MEPKDTLSLCSDSNEQEIQQLQKQAKIFKDNSMNKFNALKTTTQRLKRQTFTNCPSFKRAFSHLFHTDVRTFKFKSAWFKRLKHHMLVREKKTAVGLYQTKGMIKTDQNAVKCDDERDALANLIVNLKLDIDENKKIQNQLKKANASLTQELKECKSTLAETSRTLGESNSIWDSCLIALQNKQTELEKYMVFNDLTVDYKKLELVKEKHDELVKQSLLTKSHYEVGVSHDLTKQVTLHSWPQVRKSSFAKPYDVNAPGPSRKSSKHVSFQSPVESVGSNDMVHNCYLEEAKKKEQLQKDKALNTKPSV
nr:hypothetical protein [Tanacetum cinerariifolium]